jgi:hypothetical protein
LPPHLSHLRTSRLGRRRLPARPRCPALPRVPSDPRSHRCRRNPPHSAPAARPSPHRRKPPKNGSPVRRPNPHLVGVCREGKHVDDGSSRVAGERGGHSAHDTNQRPILTRSLALSVPVVAKRGSSVTKLCAERLSLQALVPALLARACLQSPPPPRPRSRPRNPGHGIPATDTESRPRSRTALCEFVQLLRPLSC